MADTKFVYSFDYGCSLSLPADSVEEALKAAAKELDEGVEHEVIVAEVRLTSTAGKYEVIDGTSTRHVVIGKEEDA